MRRILPSLILYLMLIAIAVSVSASTYHLGSEDVVTVTVMRHPEFSGDFLIPTDGILDLPAVGSVKASGMTLSELTGYVTMKLRDRLVKPEVTVTLKVARTQRIYVLGAVSKPGVYDFKPEWRITEALAVAGGLSVEPADCKVTLLRAATGEKKTVELIDALHTAPGTNLALEPGDVLTINAVEEYPIYVLGKVKTPGMYKMRGDGGGVLEALSMAGGTLDDAGISHVTITHSTGQAITLDLAPSIVNGKPEANPKLLPGDVVMVPEAARIAVLGYVHAPGYYPLSDGKKITLSDALGLAQGAINPQGSMGKVAVVRTLDGKQQRLTFNLSKFLKTGDTTQNPEMKPGDVIYVPKTSRLEWTTVVQTLSSVGVLFNGMGFNN